MTNPTLWWLLTGAAIAIELLTGSFYLLMVALGLAAAAIAAHLGAGMAAQLVTAALVGGGSATAWYFKGDRKGGAVPAQADPNVNLDVGETLQIDSWNADGTASVHYRGAKWTAMHRPGAAAVPGSYRVAELVGSRLLVDKI